MKNNLFRVGSIEFLTDKNRVDGIIKQRDIDQITLDELIRDLEELQAKRKTEKVRNRINTIEKLIKDTKHIIPTIATSSTIRSLVLQSIQKAQADLQEHFNEIHEKITIVGGKTLHWYFAELIKIETTFVLLRDLYNLLENHSIRKWNELYKEYFVDDMNEEIVRISSKQTSRSTSASANLVESARLESIANLMRDGGYGFRSLARYIGEPMVELLRMSDRAVIFIDNEDEDGNVITNL